MKTLEDAPRAQRLAALGRTVDAARAILDLPALNCPQGKRYDIGVLANWAYEVAGGLGLTCAERELETVVADWFTTDRAPTLDQGEIAAALLMAACEIDLAIREEMRRCA